MLGPGRGGPVINARPGYWDVNSCAWVGAEPMYVVPPARPAEHTHDRALGAAGVDVPAPRADVDSAAPLVPEAPAG